MVKIKLFFLVLKGEMNAWGKEFGLSQKEEKIRATGENDRVETVYRVCICPIRLVLAFLYLEGMASSLVLSTLNLDFSYNL